MSLFGALTSGVSGLSAQSSAMGTIADNITNVNTVGYKGTGIDFQTLVTRQGSQTRYSAGGVQARAQGGVNVQGLLQSSASATDLALSGNGFFLVNRASEPAATDPYMFTRAGSFSTDAEGFLRNGAGYYLQGWPTNSLGEVVLPNGSAASMTNQNIISRDFLETINLNRFSGTAAATTKVALSANLPAAEANGSSRGIDVQLFDSLGNALGTRFNFTKQTANTWDLAIEPPAGTAVASLLNADGEIYRSAGQLEFTAQPMDGATVSINGSAYTFAASGGGAGTVTIGQTLAETVANLVAAVSAADTDFGSSAGAHQVELKGSDKTTVVFTAGSGSGLGSIAIDATTLSADSTGTPATQQGLLATPSFTIAQPQTSEAGLVFGANGLPQSFGAASLSIRGFINGAADMDGAAASTISLNFGQANRANGITQFGTEFTTNLIERDGTRYGGYSGVSVAKDGLVYALFDNGERRPVFKMPVATFVNPTGLQAVAGNSYAVTEESGSPSLRAADSGPAGSIIQSSLESSTVDIGDEFSRMIVVQRAYSAATKIISTADEMLEELVRIKR